MNVVIFSFLARWQSRQRGWYHLARVRYPLCRVGRNQILAQSPAVGTQTDLLIDVLFGNLGVLDQGLLAGVNIGSHRISYPVSRENSQYDGCGQDDAVSHKFELVKL